MSGQIAAVMDQCGNDERPGATRFLATLHELVLGLTPRTREVIRRQQRYEYLRAGKYASESHGPFLACSELRVDEYSRLALKRGTQPVSEERHEMLLDPAGPALVPTEADEHVP